MIPAHARHTNVTRGARAVRPDYELAGMEDLRQFLESLDELFDLFGVFIDCGTSGKHTLLEKAEHTLRDIVYLESVLPEGESLVNTVSDLVVCMREEVETVELHYSAERRGRGRPAFDVSSKKEKRQVN